MFRAESVISVGSTDVQVGTVRASRGSVTAKRAVDAARPLWLQRLGSIAGLVVVVWAVPFFVLALPLMLAWRAVLQATKWRRPDLMPT